MAKVVGKINLAAPTNQKKSAKEKWAESEQQFNRAVEWITYVIIDPRGLQPTKQTKAEAEEKFNITPNAAHAALVKAYGSKKVFEIDFNYLKRTLLDQFRNNNLGFRKIVARADQINKEKDLGLHDKSVAAAASQVVNELGPVLSENSIGQIIAPKKEKATLKVAPAREKPLPKKERKRQRKEFDKKRAENIKFLG
ncbi:hypothetical protein ACFL2R_02270 [Patescibacteria group bacterium]